MKEKLSDDEKRAAWRRLCGLAVQLLGSQDQFKREANILRRLAKQYGPVRTEYMLRGAIAMHWTSLVSLGSKDGLGRRIAEKKYWDSQKTAPLPESAKSIIRRMLT